MSKELNQFLEENLTQLKNKGLYNEIEPLASANGAMITIGQQELINLSSNNYLGLATEPRLVSAAKTALDQWGAGLVPLEQLMGRYKFT